MRAKEIVNQADERNKRNIDSQTENVCGEWKSLVKDLENRRDTLTQLTQVWETFEGRWQNFESLLTGIEERTKHLDYVVRSKEHVTATRDSIKELQSEAESLKNKRDEVKDLSKSVLSFLGDCSATSASALKDKLNQLEQSYER